MKIKDIISAIETKANISLQEDYDNSGLIYGNPTDEVQKVLVSIDCTEEVIDEAIKENCNMVVSHHPLIFGGLKKITGKNFVERTLIKAIKNNIAIYAAHTNLDNCFGGVNFKIAMKMGLKHTKILRPMRNKLLKLVVFCPVEHADDVRLAMFHAGAGTIGDYDYCSFNAEGLGSFKAGAESNPFVGKKGEVHFEKELRVETILPSYLLNRVVGAMINAHPYEEVAYDVYPLANEFHKAGSGITGELEQEMEVQAFFEIMKKTFQIPVIKHTKSTQTSIKKVALCGGAGSFLIKDAISIGADIFITGDIKYHQFFDAGKKIILADIGHYESEQFTTELLFDVIREKFPNFAVLISKTKTNPVYYY